MGSHVYPNAQKNIWMGGIWIGSNPARPEDTGRGFAYITGGGGQGIISPWCNTVQQLRFDCVLCIDYCAVAGLSESNSIIWVLNIYVWAGVIDVGMYLCMCGGCISIYLYVLYVRGMGIGVWLVSMSVGYMGIGRVDSMLGLELFMFIYMGR